MLVVGFVLSVLGGVALAGPASANMLPPPRPLTLVPNNSNLLGASRWDASSRECDPRRSTLDLTVNAGPRRGGAVALTTAKARWRGNRGGRYGILRVTSGDGSKVRTYRTNGAIGGPIHTPQTEVEYKINDTFAYPVHFEVGESLDRFDEPTYCTNSDSVIPFEGVAPR